MSCQKKQQADEKMQQFAKKTQRLKKLLWDTIKCFNGIARLVYNRIRLNNELMRVTDKMSMLVDNLTTIFNS